MNKPNITSFLNENFSKVIYQIGENELFGTGRYKDNIVKGYLIFSGDDSYLLYFPPNYKRGECGSISICKYNSLQNYYYATDETYINCPNISSLMKLKFSQEE